MTLPLINSENFRRLAALLLALPLAASAAGADVPAHPRDLVFPDVTFVPPERDQHRHVLPSGVVVYVAEDHDLPLVDVQVFLRTGAYLEPSGKAGLASLVGSQLRQGGTVRQTPEELDEELAFLAANLGTSISDTQGLASFNCLTKNLPRVLEIFVDVLRTPRFDEGRLKLERSQRLQDLARRNDETPGIEAREWERLLRGDGFFTTDQVTSKSIEGISREDLLAFHKRTIHPKSFIIAVSGDIKTQEALERLEVALGAWAREPAQLDPVPPIPQPAGAHKAGLYIVDKPSVNQGRVSIGHVAPRRNDPDQHALILMNQILGGGGFTSRITSRVRSDEGLAYTAASRLELGIYFDGVFRAFFQSKSESVGKAARIVLEEIDRIRKDRVTEEELTTAANFMIGAFPRAFATAQGIASTLATDELTGRPVDHWRTFREKLKKVTADDVLRVARQHLKPESLIILVVGNAEEILKGGMSGGAVTRIPLPDPSTLEYPKS